MRWQRLIEAARHRQETAGFVPALPSCQQADNKQAMLSMIGHLLSGPEQCNGVWVRVNGDVAARQIGQFHVRRSLESHGREGGRLLSGDR
jgi:hypothetical protein